MEPATTSTFPNSDPLRDFAESRGTSVPRDAMAEACRQLRVGVGELSPPIDLRPLLQKMDVKVVHEETSGDAILRRRTGGGWSIGISKDAYSRSRRRSRFTIAHELGHIILFRAFEDLGMSVRALQSPEHWQAVESLCNFAAAELLLPRETLESALRTRGLGGETIGDLRRTFDVSWQALWIRIAEVLPSTSVATWKFHARPDRNEREAFRVTQSYGGGRSRPWLPEGLTSRYLDPDLISEAADGGDALAIEVDLNLSRTSKKIHALAINSKQLLTQSEPGLFDPTPIAHFRPLDADVVIFMTASEAVSSGAIAPVWEATRSAWQVRNGVSSSQSLAPEEVSSEGQLALQLDI
ncbi:MAG TPA: ImmA/IrrE family metallo-endopeptidase [Solirubrobacterales bacterium]|nr:ImmA/IrrE family metallo-endopeptidase [Solirubrobacterales bacterium]